MSLCPCSGLYWQGPPIQPLSLSTVSAKFSNKSMSDSINLFCTIQHCAVLCCTNQYHTVLCCTAMHSEVVCFVATTLHPSGHSTLVYCALLTAHVGWWRGQDDRGRGGEGSPVGSRRTLGPQRPGKPAPWGRSNRTVRRKSTVLPTRGSSGGLSWRTAGVVIVTGGLALQVR